MSSDSVCRVGEPLVIGNAAAQRQLLMEALDTGASVLDLSGVAECDTSGVQLLLAAHKTAQALGTPLELRGASEPVRELFGRYGLGSLLSARSSEGPRT